jgi:hypothetical protein
VPMAIGCGRTDRVEIKGGSSPNPCTGLERASVLRGRLVV